MRADLATSDLSHNISSLAKHPYCFFKNAFLLVRSREADMSNEKHLVRFFEFAVPNRSVAVQVKFKTGRI